MMGRTVCIIARDPDAALRYAEAVAHGLLHNLYPSRTAADEMINTCYPLPMRRQFTVYEFTIDRTPGKVTVTPVR